MPNALEIRVEILSRLIASLLDEGTPFTFYPKYEDGATEFKLEVPPEFMGAFIGEGGHHFRALCLIFDVMGKEVGQKWTLDLLEPEFPKAMNRPHSPPETHDESDDALLLADLLDACGVNADVLARGGIAAGYDFDIHPDTRADLSALLGPHAAKFKRTKRGSSPINLLVALRTIWRAIGKGQGVEYRVNAGDVL